MPTNTGVYGLASSHLSVALTAPAFADSCVLRVSALKSGFYFHSMDPAEIGFLDFEVSLALGGRCFGK